MGDIVRLMFDVISLKWRHVSNLTMQKGCGASSDAFDIDRNALFAEPFNQSARKKANVGVVIFPACPLEAFEILDLLVEAGGVEGMAGIVPLKWRGWEIVSQVFYAIEKSPRLDAFARAEGVPKGWPCFCRAVGH